MTQPTRKTDHARTGPVASVYGPNGDLEPEVLNGVVILSADGTIPTGQPLPDGAATAAKQDTGNTSLATIAGTLPMTNAQFLANLRSTATHSAVNSTNSSVTILASNANRKGARIFNTDANALYLDLSGGTAVAASRAQVKLATDEGYDVPFGCTGLITGIWTADGSGVASVVEFA